MNAPSGGGRMSPSLADLIATGAALPSLSEDRRTQLRRDFIARARASALSKQASSEQANEQVDGSGQV